MPQLNTHRVKHRLAEMNRDLTWLSEATGIPYGTLRNVVTKTTPEPTNLRRVYLIAGALDLSYSDVAAKGDDGVPDNPPSQPTKGPTGPTRRQDKEKDRKSPKRVAA